MTDNQADNKAFHIVADMEDDLKFVHDVAIAIVRLTEVMHDDQQLAASLNHLAGEIEECTKAIEEQQQRIFKLLHPVPELAPLAPGDMDS
jgi:hypothetical protein